MNNTWCTPLRTPSQVTQPSHPTLNILFARSPHVRRLYIYTTLITLVKIVGMAKPQLLLLLFFILLLCF